MAFQIVVPNLGESVVEATVARWLKQSGEAVQVGEPVVVLETEKVDLEVGAEQSGVLGQISRNEGEDVKIGDVLGVIEEGALNGASAPAPAAAAPTTPPPTLSSAPSAAAATPDPAATVTNETANPPAPVPTETPNVDVTPVARRMAQDAGVNVGEVQPSAGNKVTKTDVQRFLESRATPPPASPTNGAPASTPAPSPASDIFPPLAGVDGYRREERVKMSRRRRTIAARLVEAQHTAAMLTTFNELDMTAVMAMRDKRKESFKQKYGVGLGFSSFFVKASIGALKAYPRLNAEIQGDEMVLKHYYDIGVAIGAEEGLVVPVLRDADRMSFAEIESGIKQFAAQANDGTLSLESLRGGTFTITNGGVFGSMLSTPILNPPQMGILGLHKIEQRPIALNGEVVIRPMMYVALSYDHRIVDGREAVQFLVRMKELIEDPENLLIEG